MTDKISDRETTLQRLEAFLEYDWADVDIDDEDFAAEMADALHETEKVARNRIQEIVREFNRAWLMKLLQKTLEIERSGGMLVNSGKRRRTTGGVFFAVGREEAVTDSHRMIFISPQMRWYYKKQKRVRKIRNKSLEWDERLEVIEKIENLGEGDEMFIRLSGRPGDVRRKGSTVVIQMAYENEFKSMPAGLPPFPEKPTVCTVYLDQRQWNRVRKQIKAGTHKLEVEGIACFDEEIPGLVVYTQHTHMRQLDTPESDEDTPETESETAPESAETEDVAKADEPASSPAPAATTADVEPDVDVPADISEDDQEQLEKLEAAAEKLRQKIADAEESGKRSGVKMTKRLLKNTQKQIDNILKKYA